VSWKPGIWSSSAIVVRLWGYFLWVGVHEPLGGINQLFPIFGISNQLLAAVALAVCTTLLVKSGRLKWAWITGVPLAWDATVTLTASWQKVFSSDPRVGFFKQRSVYQDGIDAGQGPAARQEHGRHAHRRHQLHGRRRPFGHSRPAHRDRDRGRRRGCASGTYAVPRSPRSASRRTSSRRSSLRPG
jgi:hypothetical protein